jgi:agmatine deiminase
MPKKTLLPPPYKSMILPAEWEKQSAIWFTWPQNADTWTPVWEEAKAAYKEIIHAALRFQDVMLLVNDSDLRARLEKELRVPDATIANPSGAGFHLEILVCPTNDSWIRDYGAITVRASDFASSSGSVDKSPAPASKLITLDFTFNSWGGKYPPWDKDDAVPVFMAKRRERQLCPVDFVLEGGSIDANGKGLLLTTTQCLLNPNRNPDLDREAIEGILHGYLGINKTLWLESGINGDDTDGHVDDLARFTDARTVFCAIETDARDENFAPLKSNMEALNRYSRTSDLEVVEVPMPLRQVKAGLRTPATYLNFLILNGAVLVPVFQDKRDDRTLQLFEKHFSNRRIIPIDCRSLVFGQGAIHCSSMQEPAG